MADTLTHRGPDDLGVWFDEEREVALAFRRLAIIDLSPAGAQPMVSRDGRWVLAYNGEIYNFASLRHDLPRDTVLRGGSDTEVLLELLAHRGVDRTLAAVDGMFAFALWDRREQRLVLARDRFGEKPLHYTWAGSTFLFASELKAMRPHPAWNPTLDLGALALYLSRDYVPAPLTVYAGVHKLLPGTWLEVAADRPGIVEQHTYWSAAEVVAAGRAAPADVDLDGAADLLDDVLSRSVRERMVADVPLGAFLSGGIDSSLVVALMQANADTPVKTFTMSFGDARLDEAPFAAAVAAHLGTEHTEMSVSGADALAVVPALPGMYDEPFADSSQIPTFLVSALARRDVTVALTGDGGDELFGGYGHYTDAQRVLRVVERVPARARPAVAAALRATPEAFWDVVGRGQRVLRPDSRQLHGQNVRKLAAAMERSSVAGRYAVSLSRWGGRPPLALGSTVPLEQSADPRCHPDGLSMTETMMMADTLGYLPDDILVKVDRASMATSLETRIPLLDPEVFALAWRLPMDVKRSDAQGKLVLRQLLGRYVPRRLVDRPKAGFAVPLADWLRHDLRDWGEDLLAPERLRRQGLLDEPRVTRLWKQHQAGTHDWKAQLWTLLMLQAWLEENVPA